MSRGSEVMDEEEVKTILQINTLELKVKNLEDKMEKIEKTLEQNRYLAMTTLITALLTLGGIILK